MNVVSGWYPVDDGATVGQTGSEKGVILDDEEHSLGARITLEKGGDIAPFSVTCGIYGLLVHTRFFSDEADGKQAYEAMKLGLVAVADAGGENANERASAFIAEFP